MQILSDFPSFECDKHWCNKSPSQRELLVSNKTPFLLPETESCIIFYLGSVEFIVQIFTCILKVVVVEMKHCILLATKIFHEYLIIFYCICGNFFFVYVLIRFPPKKCTLFNLYIYLGIQVGEKQ